MNIKQDLYVYGQTLMDIFMHYTTLAFLCFWCVCIHAGLNANGDGIYIHIYIYTYKYIYTYTFLCVYTQHKFFVT